MELSNKQLLNSVEPLTQLNSLKLPVKTSFKIAKISRVVDNILSSYKDTLKALQEQYAEKDVNGENIVVGNQIQFQDPLAFDEAYQELLDCKTEITIDQISIDDLGSVEVEPKVFYHLDWLLKD